MDQLLTKKDLAKRWQISTATIDRYIQDKILVPVKGITVIRFNPQHIRELEGTKLEKFSPVERRKLERELEDLKRENEILKGAIARIQSITSESMYLMSKEPPFQV